MQKLVFLALMKGMAHQATRRQRATTGINSEFNNVGGEKKNTRLIAQLLDYAMHTVRSMNSAQPWIERGTNN